MKITRPTDRRAAPVRRAAFTLLEVLLVLGIIVVIAALVVPQLMGRGQEANARAARASMNGFYTALKLYAEQCGSHEFPFGNESEAVKKLMDGCKGTDGRQGKPFLEKIPKDPWRNPIKYEYQAGMKKPRIWSTGPDGVSGNEDDISMEEEEEL